MVEKILKEINRRIVISSQKRNNDKEAHAAWAELVDLERWILDNCDNDGWVPVEERLPENVENAIRRMKVIAGWHGLEVIGRIWLRDPKTGREYR